jgi:hypothetical protein
MQAVQPSHFNAGLLLPPFAASSGLRSGALGGRLNSFACVDRASRLRRKIVTFPEDVAF